jgi:hypothetical protein
MRRSWDIRPPQWIAAAARNFELEKPDEPFFVCAAADRLMRDACIGSESPDAGRAKEGFLLYDHANPHSRESFLFPIADIGPDGVRRVYRDALEAAQKALLQGPAGEAVQAEAQSVLDHYRRLFAAAKKDGGWGASAAGTGAVDQDTKPTAVDGADRGYRGTELGRAYAKVLQRRAVREQQMQGQRRAKARDKLRKHRGEDAVREVVARDTAARRQEHGLPLPRDYAEPLRLPGR